MTRLKKLVPEARIAVGHGQMREHALEDVMLDFYEGKFDVLLCTTIIEAGLDVPARQHAHRLRRRPVRPVLSSISCAAASGRCNRLAYCLSHRAAPPRCSPRRRKSALDAIREFTEFGSGFRVAMRDLEIRGAGNLLGSGAVRLHGHRGLRPVCEDDRGDCARDARRRLAVAMWKRAVELQGGRAIFRRNTCPATITARGDVQEHRLHPRTAPAATI